MNSPARILYVVNDAGFFLSHRLALAREAREAGYDVHVATPVTRAVEGIRAERFSFHAIPISRWGLRIWEEMGSLFALYRLYNSLRPDLVHHVTIKPVLYGGTMARLARVPAVVNVVTGLGYVFISRGLKGWLLRNSVKLVYRLALNHPNSRVVFQNPDDRETFVRNGLVDASAAVLIKGSGVDVNEFSPTPEPLGRPLVLLASRLLWDKGVGEYVEAARRLREEGVKARFVLVGDSDFGNPAMVMKGQLEAWHRSGIVEWWGHRDNMSAVFAQAHVVCLPSYREGLPKVLIEGAACGRPIVATDVAGCREIVHDEHNGLLVRPRDAVALADALRRLIENPSDRQRMGLRGREIVMTEFSLAKVIGDTLAVYRELLG